MKKLIYLTAASLLLGVSCSDDFTEIPPVGVLESTTFFNKESNAEEALIGLYDLMQYNYGKDWSGVFFMKQLPGDASNKYFNIESSFGKCLERVLQNHCFVKFNY